MITMIFPGYLELTDINKYRYSAMRRKIEHYKVKGKKSCGVSQLEFEILEAIERTREYNLDFPYVEVIELGDASKARRSHELSPRVYCDFIDNNEYGIF